MNYARKRIAEIEDERRKATVRVSSVPNAASLLAVLGNYKRLLTMIYLIEGEASVADLVAKMGGSRSALSKHLKEMMELGLVDYRSEGTWRFYFCKSNEARIIVRWLERLADEGAEPLMSRRSGRGKL